MNIPNKSMTEIKAAYNFANRDSSGQFAPKNYGEKKIRSMKLTDHAWNTLESMGTLQGVSRTDIIEQLTRQETAKKEIDKKQIILQALQKFVQLKKESFPKHLTQKGKEFSTDTRSWDALNEFLVLLENSPEDLGIE